MLGAEALGGRTAGRHRVRDRHAGVGPDRARIVRPLDHPERCRRVRRIGVGCRAARVLGGDRGRCVLRRRRLRAGRRRWLRELKIVVSKKCGAIKKKTMAIPTLAHGARRCTARWCAGRSSAPKMRRSWSSIRRTLRSRSATRRRASPCPRFWCARPTKRRKRQIDRAPAPHSDRRKRRACPRAVCAR